MAPKKGTSSSASSSAPSPTLLQSFQPWRAELTSVANQECWKALVAYYFHSSIESTKERLNPVTMEENFKKIMADFFWSSPENFMELSKNMVSSHPKNGCGYFLGSLAHFRVLLTEFSMKDWEYFDTALTMAEKAANLAPNSVEYCLYFASLLFLEVRSCKAGYEFVIQECERGLLIENPQDPTNELIWMKELGKERSGEDIGVWNRLVSEHMKGKIRLLMEAVKKENDAEEIPVDEDTEENQDDLKMILLKQNKKNIDAGFVALEALKLWFVSPFEQRNVKDASPVQRSSRSGGRKKSADDHKKISADADRKNRIMEFLREMNDETKMGLLTVSIDELKQHFGLSKNKPLEEVLNEAIEYVKKERKWVRWFCYACDKEMFADSESWRNHVKNEHLGELEPQLQEMEPELAGDEWTKNIENGFWKPMNVSETSESQSGLESKAAENDVKKRAELIRSVHGLMKSLMADKCLAKSHFDKLMAYLQTCFTELRAVDYGLDSICFLNVPQLKKVFEFLKDLAFSCGLTCYTENVIRDLRHMLCVEEGIILSVDLLSLVLGKRSFPDVPYTGTWLTDPEDYQSVIFSADGDYEFPDSDAFLDLLFPGPTLEEHLERLEILKEGSKLQVRNILKTLEEEFKTLKSSCEEKAKLKGLRKELQHVEDVAAEAAQSEGTEKQKDNADKELDKLDATILAGVRFKRQGLQKLELLCCWDYRIDMVYLLKLLILARVEEQANEYAAVKAEEAARSLLYECDAEKNIKNSGDPSTQTESSKKKKKNKNRKKGKSKKLSGSQDVEEEPPTESEVAEGSVRSDVGVTISTEEIQEDEEQLEKQLEAQRKFEEEAREKALAEQKRKTDANLAENEAEKSSSVDTKPVEDDSSRQIEKSKPVSSSTYEIKFGSLPIINFEGLSIGGKDEKEESKAKPENPEEESEDK